MKLGRLRLQSRIMNRLLRCWLLLPALVVLAGCKAEDPVEALRTAPRSKAPIFEVTSMDGERKSLASLKGKVVLVEFWATWCTYCVGGMPALDELYRSHREQGLEVMMISNEDPAKVKAFVEDQPYDLPFYLDHNGEGHTFYDVVSYPSSVIIDREGNVVAKLRGAHPNSTLLEVLDAAGLNDAPNTVARRS